MAVAGCLAKLNEARTVAVSRPGGTDSGAIPAISGPKVDTSPRRVSLPCNRSRARDSRDNTVPLGHPSRKAAAASVLRPSR